MKISRQEVYYRVLSGITAVKGEKEAGLGRGRRSHFILQETLCAKELPQVGVRMKPSYHHINQSFGCRLSLGRRQEMGKVAGFGQEQFLKRVDSLGLSVCNPTDNIWRAQYSIY